MLYLVRLSQQVVDTLAPEEVTNYTKVRDATLQNLNLSPETYWRHLREVAFGPNLYPSLNSQKIRVARLWWLHPAIPSAAELAEAVRPSGRLRLHFKLNNWIMGHKPATLEEAVLLTEALVLAEMGTYLIPKAWKEQGQTKQGPCWSGEQQGWAKQTPRQDTEGLGKPTREGEDHEQ